MFIGLLFVCLDEWFVSVLGVVFDFALRAGFIFCLASGPFRTRQSVFRKCCVLFSQRPAFSALCGGMW